jgi:hypothetical protein
MRCASAASDEPPAETGTVLSGSKSAPLFTVQIVSYLWHSISAPQPILPVVRTHRAVARRHGPSRRYVRIQYRAVKTQLCKLACRLPDICKDWARWAGTCRGRNSSRRSHRPSVVPASNRAATRIPQTCEIAAIVTLALVNENQTFMALPPKLLSLLRHLFVWYLSARGRDSGSLRRDDPRGVARSRAIALRARGDLSP